MIKKLSEREHIIQRPAMYIGAVDLTKSNEYIIEDNKIQYKEIEYVPGLIKIINEIIDNSVDVAIKTNFKSSNEISVKMTKDTVEVQDNGTGIPVQKNEDGQYLAELAWGHARAGSNFDDDANRTQIGMNGVGSFATNCFSKKFIGTTDDGKKHYTITFTDNAEHFTGKEEKAKGKSGVHVKFWPDLDKFGLTEIDEVHQNVIKQRLINLSMSFPEINFKFNGRKINVNTFKKYTAMFGDNAEVYETEDYKFAILSNEADDFRQFSYVNGLKIPDGGTHIDVIMYNLVNGVRDKLVKKYKNIKPGDIKNKLMIVAFLKDVKNTKFNSQSKEKITNSIKEMNEYYGVIPYDKILARLLRNKSIIEPITEVYRIKEELLKNKELKDLDKKANKKPKDEKFLEPVGEWRDIYLCEGDSAKSSISAILGREGIGYFAMFGVPPNAYKMPAVKLAKSVKFQGIQKIVGLQLSRSKQTDLNFRNIVLATDADLPGFFIRGQLIGLLYKYGRNLFDEGRVKILRTPLFIATKNDKIVAWFYDFETQRRHQEKNPKLKYEYKKGLGSWDQEELQYIIEQEGLDVMLETLSINDEAEAEKTIDAWLGSDTDIRKDMLSGFEFNINNQ